MSLRRALTLIELLIVITIILTLMGLLSVTFVKLRFNAMALDTTQRIQGIFQAISRIGQMEGSVTMAMQRDAQLDGVTLFDQEQIQANKALVPKTGAGTLLSSDSGWTFLSPWGKRRLDGSNPGSRSLDQLNPRASARILMACGIVPDAATYASDRSTRVAWNDRWGSPFVVAYGIYQPNTLSDMRGSLLQYQYNRSLYITVAANGPARRGALVTTAGLNGQMTADAAGTLLSLWQQACDVCAATDWRVDYAVTPPVNAMDNPPWEGVRRSSKGKERCFLAAPLEYK